MTKIIPGTVKNMENLQAGEALEIEREEQVIIMTTSFLARAEGKKMLAKKIPLTLVSETLLNVNPCKHRFERRRVKSSSPVSMERYRKLQDNTSASMNVDFVLTDQKLAR